MTGPGIVQEPRPERFKTAAQYRRALSAWIAGIRWQEDVARRIRHQRRVCGPCEP